MSQSQGLTSLKDQAPAIEPSVVSPSKNQDTAVSLQNTIRLLQKKQDNLLFELRNLANTSAETKKRTKEEIDQLKKRKRNLLAQVKSLSDLVLGLSGNKEAVIKAYEKLGSENMTVLDSIAHSLNVDITAHSSAFAKKFKKLEDWEVFLTGLADHLAEYAKITESESRSQASEQLFLQDKAQRLVEKDKSLKESMKSADKSLGKAENLLKLADRRFEDADSLALYFEKVADQERKDLGKEIMKVALENKKILAAQRTLDARKEALKKKEVQLRDKEATLQRVYEEVKAKAKKVGVLI